MHRLKIARGHLSQVIKMTERGEHCIDVIHQSQAVQAALRSTNRMILKHHLETCITYGSRQKTHMVEEMLRVMEKAEK